MRNIKTSAHLKCAINVIVHSINSVTVVESDVTKLLRYVVNPHNYGEGYFGDVRVERGDVKLPQVYLSF